MALLAEREQPTRVGKLDAAKTNGIEVVNVENHGELTATFAASAGPRTHLLA